MNARSSFSQGSCVSILTLLQRRVQSQQEYVDARRECAYFHLFEITNVASFVIIKFMKVECFERSAKLKVISSRDSYFEAPT